MFESKALEGLTLTERKVISEFSKGLRPKEIATKLNISVRTVYKALYKYRKNLKKLGLVSEVEKYRIKRVKSSKVIQNENSISRSEVSNIVKEANIPTSSVSDYTQNLQFQTTQLQNLLAQILGGMVWYSFLQNGNNTNTMFREMISVLKQLVQVLESIDEKLARLVNNIYRINESLLKGNAMLTSEEEKSNTFESNETLPSFLLDNPWIEVLRMRGKD